VLHEGPDPPAAREMCTHDIISRMAEARDSTVCSVCGAFDAVFAKLLWTLVVVLTRGKFYHRFVLCFRCVCVSFRWFVHLSLNSV